MRFRGLLLIVLLALGLVACGGNPSNSSASPQPTQPQLRGSVDITFPASGAIIYSESIVVQGVATDTPEDGFQIAMVAPDDTTIAQATVSPEDDGTWSVELVHTYTGEPTEVTLVAKTTVADNPLDYDIESIVLATLDYRPEGVFGSILVPQSGEQVGGDAILVSGRGSGFFENTFILSLIDAEGDTVVQTPVTMTNPNLIDDMLWQVELPRRDFIGNATLRMSYQDAESGETIIVDEIDVVVSSVAG